MLHWMQMETFSNLIERKKTEKKAFKQQFIDISMEF